MTHPWILAIRPKTLPASVAPILLGSAVAAHDKQFNLVVFVLCLICAMALQIAVNLANDFFDAQSGVDTKERLGPTRVVQAGLLSGRTVLTGLAVFCVIAIVSGLFIVYLSSIWLLAFGMASLIAVFAYSAGPKPIASLGLGEFAVFLFFGLLAVAGTYYAQALGLNWTVMSFAIISGLMSAAIMLVNNIRDIPTDSISEKRTLAVKLGETKSKYLYCGFLAIAVVIHCYLVRVYSWLILLPLVVVLPLALRLCRLILSRSGRRLNQHLAETAMLGLLYSLTTGLALILI